MSSGMPKNNSIPPDEKLVRLQLNVDEEDAAFVKAFVRAVRDARRLGLPRPQFAAVSSATMPSGAGSTEAAVPLAPGVATDEPETKTQKSSGKDRSLGALLGDHLSKKED